MDTNFTEDLDRARPPIPGHHATRRDIMAALPLLGAGVAVTLWAPSPARPEDGLPTGVEAADLAAKITKAAWPEPRKAYIPGHHYLFAGWRLERLLKSYAVIHLGRLGAEARAAHMLGVAEVVTGAAGAYADAYRAVENWFDGDSDHFLDAKFPLAWRQARMIELARHGVQLARLRGALAISG